MCLIPTNEETVIILAIQDFIKDFGTIFSIRLTGSKHIRKSGFSF
jgi:hypothetical protein